MTTMRLLPLIAISLLMTAGCSTNMAWDKDGGTQQQFVIDDDECLRKTHPVNPPIRMETWYFPVYQSCMIARGYVLVGLDPQVGPQTRQFVGE